MSSLSVNKSVGSAQFEKMVNTPIPKLVTALAIPAVVSTIITVIYNTADTYFVSQINKSASAAVGVVFSIMSIIQAVGFGLAMGASSLVSRKLGEKDNESANKYASCAFFTALAAGAFVGLVCLCALDPMLRLIGATDTMLPYARPYAMYILIGAPISCSTFVLSNTTRSEGHTSYSMWGMGIGGILNVILDPIFIFVLNMKTGGAALATVVSQCVSFIILLYLFVSQKTIVRISPKHLSRYPKDYMQVFLTGLPTIFRQGLGSVASAALNIQASVYGDATVAAITIANKVYVLLRNIIIGIGQGFQPVAGYNFGAGKKKRTWQAFTFACVVGSVVCVLSAVVIGIFASDIMNWFSKDAEVVAIGYDMLLISCAVMPFMGVSTFVNQLYQCLGFKVGATFLASCRQGVFFLPLVILLPMFLERLGVLATQPLSDFLTFLICIPFLVRFYNKRLKE